jgi:hypothetical protein
LELKVWAFLTLLSGMDGAVEDVEESNSEWRLLGYVFFGDD